MALLINRRPIVPTLLAAIIAVSAVAGGVSAEAADRDGRLTIDGRMRTYSMHIPDAAPPKGGFPLVLAFHGGGGQGARMRKLSGFDTLADSRGVIIVYPDGIDKHWNDGRSTIRNPQDDVGFVSALLNQLEVSAPVDTHRIYATGLSNGALFAERLGCDLSTRIAAIAPVAGTLPSDIARTCRPARRVAVLQIGGTADPIMPFDGGKVADFGGRGEGGVVSSVASTSNFWAIRNGCGSPTSVALRPIKPLDPTRIVRTRFSGCPVASPVEVLTVEGGGHTWPGGPNVAATFLVGHTSRQLDASEAILDFFLALPPDQSQ